jgi:hypothetical protein
VKGRKLTLASTPPSRNSPRRARVSSRRANATSTEFFGASATATATTDARVFPAAFRSSKLSPAATSASYSGPTYHGSCGAVSDMFRTPKRFAKEQLTGTYLPFWAVQYAHFFESVDSNTQVWSGTFPKRRTHRRHSCLWAAERAPAGTGTGI